MVITSTLIYLVDEFNEPSDMLLNSNDETILQDEYICTFLNLLETDPGESLVASTLARLEE